MCTCRGRSRNADPGRARRPCPRRDAGAPAFLGHPDDLVVEVVVPRRLAGRDEAGEEGRARRSVVRAEEDLERPRARRRLASGSSSERDEVRAGPSARAGRPRAPTVATTLELVASRTAWPPLPRGRAPRCRGAQVRSSRPFERSGRPRGARGGASRAPGSPIDAVVPAAASVSVLERERRAVERADIERVVHEAASVASGLVAALAPISTRSCSATCPRTSPAARTV